MLVIGRLLDAEGREPGSLVVRQGGPKGRRVQADAFGRFRLKLPANARTVNLSIERGGQVIATHSIDAAAIEGELQLEVPTTPRPQRGPTALAVDELRGQRLVERALPGLRDRARGLGLDELRIAEVERLVQELEDLSLQATPALSGDPDALGRLRASLAGEAPFDFSLDLGRFTPFPDDFGIDPCRVLPRSPWTLVQAGMLMDAGEGHLWAGRAVTAILRRSEPAARVSRALSGIEAGQVDASALVEAMDFAGRVAAADPATSPAWEALRDPTGADPGGPQTRPLPPGGPDPRPGGFEPRLGGFDPRPGGFDLPRRPGIGTLLNRCNLEWLECAHTFVTARPPANPRPPAVGRVEPTDIAAGAATQITLHPPPGESFPVDQHSSWSISLGGTALTVASWATDEIVLDVPALPASCLGLTWLVDQLESALFLNEQAAACGRFFGGRRPVIRPVLPFSIDQISVVGTPVVEFFTADGVGGRLNAPGCTPVAVAWSVDPLVCPDTTSTLAVEVRDDRGTIVYGGPARSGSQVLTEQADRTYTLTATTTLAGAQAGAGTATLVVDRFQTVTLLEKTAPGGPVKAATAVTLRVTLSCQADDDVDVVVASNHPDRCPGLTIRVPAGQSSASGQVQAGAKCGSVTLSASIPAVPQTPATMSLLVHDPKVDSLVGASVEQCDGGSVTVRVSCAATVSTIVLSGPAGTVAGSTPALTASVAGDPASGTIQAVSSFPATPAGSYGVRVLADGILLTTGPITVAMGPPSVSVTASPNSVQVCGATAVTLTATARRAGAVSITASDGTVLAGPVTTTNLCGNVSATTTAVVSDTTTFKAIATRQGAPTATGQTTVQGATFVSTASKVAVFNGNAPGDPALYVYVNSAAPGAAAATISRVGAIARGAQVVYSPARCEVFELFAGTVDSAGIITSNLWTWRSLPILGHPSGATPTFSAFGT